MKRKVRHALVQYTITRGEKTTFETAFRNQIVDIPEDQVERLDELGATVVPDASLERPGTMSALAASASDSEITNWVIGASNEEIEELVRERPAMADRIESIHASVKERFEEQNLHLGGLKETLAGEAEETKAAEEAKNAEETKAAEESKTAEEAKAAEEADLIGGPTTLSEEDADHIVEDTAKSVIEHISENPETALVLLEAEGRRSAARNEDVRVSIVNAAKAAVSFTQ